MARPVIPPHALCVCGHDHDAHEHFRRGTDCGLCSCSRFRLAQEQPGDRADPGLQTA